MPTAQILFLLIFASFTIFDAFAYDKPKAVVWLVPSITILDQTIKNLKQFTNTEEYEEGVINALTILYGRGSEQIIKTSISDYSAELIEYDDLNKVFYKYIDYVKKYDEKLAGKMDKQMDIIYKQERK